MPANGRWDLIRRLKVNNNLIFKDMYYVSTDKITAQTSVEMKNAILKHYSNNRAVGYVF